MVMVMEIQCSSHSGSACVCVCVPEDMVMGVMWNEVAVVTTPHAPPGWCMLP